MKVIGVQDRRISFDELWMGLALDKEYGPRLDPKTGVRSDNSTCKELLNLYLARHDLTEKDFTGPVTTYGCHNKLIRVWLGYEGFPIYFAGKEQSVRFDIDGIKPTTFLQEANLPKFEISRLDLERFLFRQNLPLPAPDVKDKTIWFHGNMCSTEFIKIGEKPEMDDNLWDLLANKYDLERELEAQAGTNQNSKWPDESKVNKLKSEIEIKQQQEELHRLYCEKRGCPVIGSDEYKLLWDELSRFYGITTELDELKQAVPDKWRLERKRLLNQEIEAIKGWCKHERKSPTTGDEEVLKDYPNTFEKYRSQAGNSRESNKVILQEYIEKILKDNPKGISNKDIWNKLEKYDSEGIIKNINKIYTSEDMKTATLVVKHLKNKDPYNPMKFSSFENRVAKARKTVG